MWTCVRCSSKIDGDFEVCWNCGTSREGVVDPNFVTADESAPIVDPLYDTAGSGVIPQSATSDIVELPIGSEADMVEAYQAFSLMESKFLADQLLAQGIPAMSDTQDMQDFMGVMDGNPRVWVRREDLDRARAWLTEYESKRNTEHGHPHHHAED